MIIDKRTLPSKISVKYKATIYSNPITSPADSVRILRKLWDNDLMNIQEQVYVLYLNMSNQVIGWRCITTGKCDEVTFNVKLTLAIALECLACKVIVAHNHPSGPLRPSDDDILYTNKLHRALQLVDMVLLDSFILNDKDHFSFRQNGVKIE